MTIKTWQELAGLSEKTQAGDLEWSPECLMQTEIDELRAELRKAVNLEIHRVDHIQHLVQQRDFLLNENVALLAANSDSMDHYNELRDELEKIKAQEPIALLDGNSEHVYFQSDTMYHYWIGRNCTPLYLSPVPKEYE